MRVDCGEVVELRQEEAKEEGGWLLSKLFFFHAHAYEINSAFELRTDCLIVA